MTFWERLKEEIKSENTTQEWVAKQAGISYRTFRGWLSKKVMPNADQAVAIAKALGVSVEYLVTGESPGEDLLFSQLQARPQARRLAEAAVILPDNRVEDLLKMAILWLADEEAAKGQNAQ